MKNLDREGTCLLLCVGKAGFKDAEKDERAADTMTVTPTSFTTGINLLVGAAESTMILSRS